MVIKKRCYARVGLLGNPSDGYFGKTISLSLANFFAEVTLSPADDISVQPHPVHDLTHYPSLQDLAARCNPHATYGGVRLLLSLCRCFFLHCSRHGVPLPETQGKGFCLSYDTNIPRQAGLSGSSAIIAAGLQCLLEHFGVAGGVPLVRRPSLVLETETELGITAGLQDRVIQVYGGLVYMDFEREHMKEHGHGKYEPLATALLPKLHLVFADNPSDSGKVHSTVRQRWLAGEEEVRGAMEEVASLAAAGREALLRRDYAALATLMDRNFDLRRKMFGDEALGSVNIDMVETARSVGAAAKFTGSGGAIVTLCLEGQEQIERLQQACKQKGYEVVEIAVGEPFSQNG